MKRIRNSNIELLRIICMFMIVIHHFMAHGGLWMLAPSTNKIVVNFFMPFGKVCFDAFVAISCWFLVKSSFKGIRFLKIWLQVFFYNVVFSVLTVLMQNSDGTVGIMEIIGSFLPMIGNSHGFAAAYLVFYLFLPILKKLQDGLTKKQTGYILFVLGATQVIIPIIGYVISYTQPMQSEFLLFVFVYFLAYYLQNWPIKLLKSMGVKLILLTLILTILVGNNILSMYRGGYIFSFIMTTSSTEFSILNIMAGFLLFMIFNQIKIPNSKAVNFVASTTFGVLLLHDHNYFRTIFWSFFKNLFVWETLQPLFFIGVILVVSCCVFLIGTVIDTIRQYCLESWLLKCKSMVRIAEKIEAFTNMMKPDTNC